MQTLEHFVFECRSELEGNTLTGYAATWTATAKLPRQYERMAPTAFDVSLQRDNVLALYQHNREMPLGSTEAGNLQLRTDSKGLAFSLELPNVSYAADVKELVRSGVLNSMSFGFVPGESTWQRAQDGLQVRTHTSVARLVEISPVSIPAYDGTTLMLREDQSFGLADECINNETKRIQAKLGILLRSYR